MEYNCAPRTEPHYVLNTLSVVVLIVSVVPGRVRFLLVSVQCAQVGLVVNLIDSFAFNLKFCLLCLLEVCEVAQLGNIVDLFKSTNLWVITLALVDHELCHVLKEAGHELTGHLG